MILDYGGESSIITGMLIRGQQEIQRRRRHEDRSRVECCGYKLRNASSF